MPKSLNDCISFDTHPQVDRFRARRSDCYSYAHSSDAFCRAAVSFRWLYSEDPALTTSQRAQRCAVNPPALLRARTICERLSRFPCGGRGIRSNELICEFVTVVIAGMRSAIPQCIGESAAKNGSGLKSRPPAQSRQEADWYRL
jgi:hypothetical protein